MLWLVGGYKGRSNRYQSIYMHNDNTKEHIARQLILCTMSCFIPRHHTIANIYIYTLIFLVWCVPACMHAMVCFAL